jgi:hypothetical protein
MGASFARMSRPEHQVEMAHRATELACWLLHAMAIEAADDAIHATAARLYGDACSLRDALADLLEQVRGRQQ